MWYVEVGETVDEGDELVELELPGIVFTVTAPVSGEIVAIDRWTGNLVHESDILGWLTEDIPA